MVESSLKDTKSREDDFKEEKRSEKSENLEKEESDKEMTVLVKDNKLRIKMKSELYERLCSDDFIKLFETTPTVVDEGDIS
jgi:hypothetical protein